MTQKIYNNLNILICIVVLILSVLTSPSIGSDSKIELSSEEKSWLNQNHTVRIRIGSAPPFMLTDGKIEGIAIDYLTHIFNSNGIKFKYIQEFDVTWPQALKYIEQHQVVDMVPTAKITDARKKQMIFTDEYIFSPWVIFTRTDSPFLSSIEDLKGKTVSVEEGYAIHERLKKEYPEIRLKVISSRLEHYAEIPVRDLSTGLVDAYIGNLIMTTYMAQQKGYTNIKVAAPTPFENHNQAMAIRNDWPQLASIINKTLAAMTPDEHADILNKWLAIRYEYGISKIDVIKWLMIISVIASFFIGFVMIWNRRLQTEVNLRKKAEQAIAESKELFEKVFNSQFDAIFILDARVPATIVECNVGAFTVFGYLPEELIGRSTSQLHVDGLHQERFQEILCPAIEKDGALKNYPFLMKRKDGSAFPSEHTVLEMKDNDGKRNGWISIVRDLSEMLDTKKALSESEEESEKNRTILLEAEKLAGFGGWQWDIESDLWTLSQNWLHIHGCSKTEMVTRELIKITHPEDIPKVKTAIDRMLKDGGIYNIEYRIINQSTGEIKFIHAYGESRLSDSGKAVKMFGAAQDITDRKKLETRILHAQKMESIGNLAGGIAHDFNNILFPIIGMSELLIEDLPPGTLEHENAQEILKAGKRGRDLVKQILSFSRQDEYRVMPVRIQKVLKEVLRLIRSTIPSNIEITDRIQQDCGLILADPTQLHQIGMNLITNAYHAVEKRDGKIEILLKECDLQANTQSGNTLPSGRYVQLTVADNGVGINPDHLNKIFEPYFTTKEKGRGTGLGLSVVFGIIKEYKGDIKVYSEVDRGSTFTVYLPLMKKQIENTLPDSVEELHFGTERILLVDDDKSVLQLETQMLERLGYKVVPCIDSLDALATFELDPSAYDVVITDMTMPGMTGDQLAEKILKMRSQIPIVVCTGFSEKMTKEQAESKGIKGYLMKPVIKSELAKMVRKVLDESKYTVHVFI